MKTAGNRWTREQTIIAFNLYCKIPFQKANSSNPEIQEVARLIGRSVNSVKMKIGNFGSFDPELKTQGIVGLTNTSKLDEEIWNEFNSDWERLAFESEMLIAKLKNEPVGKVFVNDALTMPTGKEREVLVRLRVNQNFFRQTVLSAYEGTCCITDLRIPQLLVASHIKPWSKSDDKTEKVNPQNGLCLNVLHDKAFDCGLITVSLDFRLHVSDKIYQLNDSTIVYDWFMRYDGRPIRLPGRFLPHKDFLKYHNDSVFQG